VKKKVWANLQRIIELFTQKIVIKLSKYGFWIQDLRSGVIRKKPIPDHGSRGQKGTGSATLPFSSVAVLGSGMGKKSVSRISDKHPGSATLISYKQTKLIHKRKKGEKDGDRKWKKLERKR
jgi:hypothetical protein